MQIYGFWSDLWAMVIAKLEKIANFKHSNNDPILKIIEYETSLNPHSGDFPPRNASHRIGGADCNGISRLL